MKKKSVRYDEGLKESLKDPVEAAAYLNAALEDGSQGVFLTALRDIATSHGLTHIARETSLNRENMYRILSKDGNPQLTSLTSLLDKLGLQLSVKAKSARLDRG